jgi:hypothetical protein
MSPKVSLSARFNRLTHGWFYRAKIFVLGLPQSILLEEKIVTFERGANGVAELNLPEAAFSNQNVSVWIVPRSKLAEVNGIILADKRYDSLAVPKVTTGYNLEAAISMENTMTLNRRRLDYGFFSRLIPDISKSKTALTLRTLVTEPNTNANGLIDLNDPNFVFLKTNFAFAGRIQVPLKYDIVILQTCATNSGKCYLLLTAIGR